MNPTSRNMIKEIDREGLRPHEREIIMKAIALMTQSMIEKSHFYSRSVLLEMLDLVGELVGERQKLTK